MENISFPMGPLADSQNSTTARHGARSDADVTGPNIGERWDENTDCPRSLVDRVHEFMERALGDAKFVMIDFQHMRVKDDYVMIFRHPHGHWIYRNPFDILIASVEGKFDDSLFLRRLSGTTNANLENYHLIYEGSDRLAVDGPLFEKAYIAIVDED